MTNMRFITSGPQIYNPTTVDVIPNMSLKCLTKKPLFYCIMLMRRVLLLHYNVTSQTLNHFFHFSSPLILYFPFQVAGVLWGHSALLLLLPCQGASQHNTQTQQMADKT